MTSVDAESKRRNLSSTLGQGPKHNQGSGTPSEKSGAAFNELEIVPDGERELIHEVIRALRQIRYGSIVLTVHEGQVVEINKSIRIRKSRPGTKG
jgi:hypothetical protein